MKQELFLSILREGAQEEPRFGPDHLEGQRLSNQLKGDPEVLSRLSHQAGSKEATVSAAKLHSRAKATLP